MCDLPDNSPAPDAEVDPNQHYRLPRRGLLQGAMAGATLGVLARGGARLLAPTPAYAAPSSVPAGLVALINAMHIHSSYSEMQGSYDSHLAEAARVGVQVMWPTDHDWRMSAINYITSLRFLPAEKSNGTAVTYRASTSGTLASHAAALVSTPTSPNDPSGGAGHLAARSSGSAPAYSMLNVQPSDRLRTGISGTRVSLDVNPVTVGTDGWAELLITHSYHPSRGGRPAGQYQLAYRFGTQSGCQAQGLLGVVWVPVTPGGGWQSVTLDPATDIAQLWPDMASFAADNNIFDLWFRAGSRNGAQAEVFFANALIDRTRASGDQPLAAQQELLDVLGPMYGVTIRRGLEVSLYAKHSNWFGGAFHMPNYATLSSRGVTGQATQLIHGYGGLASYNHPFGVKQNSLDSQSAQDSARRSLAKTLIANRCYGVDIIEVGYHQRGGASLQTLMALADTLARNGVWLTYNGVSDNHSGLALGWTRDSAHNAFATGLWAASNSEADLLTALRAGRSYCGELGVFQGQLWYEVDGAPMGSVTISQAATRTLTVTGTGLPSSGYLEVVQGPADFAGGAYPDPATTVVATVDVRVLAGGAATVRVDTTKGSFVRLNLWDSGQRRRTGFTSPTWLLRSTPPTAVPRDRVA